MGIDPEDIGVHSIRKGAATFCCTGTTGGPSFASVCVHVGWSMGGVKDRYIHYEVAGDQVCGRAVVGLDVNSHTISVSPPHLELRNPKDSQNTDDVIEVEQNALQGGRH
jgi:hypothetical protein